MNKLKGAKDIPVGGLIDEPGSSRKFKTGDWRSFRPVWDSSKCINCMICVAFCPEDCIPTGGSGNDIKRKETDLDYCKGCGICMNVCPVKCIKMKEEAGFKK
ncbi:4Fe-4S binding protein [Candidatus Woesearchaeota archaeon]|nr:4Fe-4S binding protein [Candidatus Woesearchaeota archaeon]